MAEEKVLLQCLSFLHHASEQLAQLKRHAANEDKLPDLVNVLLFTFFHEQKAFVKMPFQPSTDLRQCMKTIGDIAHILTEVQEYVATSIGAAPDEPNLYGMINDADKLVSDCLKQISQSLHEAAEAKHGQPMAIAIPPYRPWDAVEPPMSLLLPRLIAESLRPKLTMAAKLLSGSPKDKKD